MAGRDETQGKSQSASGPLLRARIPSRAPLGQPGAPVPVGLDAPWKAADVDVKLVGERQLGREKHLKTVGVRHTPELLPDGELA